MELNAKKTKDMWITFKKSCPIPAPINIGPTELERVSEFKLLGVYVQNDLKWNNMSQVLSAKRVNGSTFLGSVKQPISLGTLVLQPYTTTIRPVLEYASPVWGGLPIYLEEDLQRVQNRCLNVIGLPRDTVESLVTRCQNLTRKEFKRILESTSLHLHLSFLIFSLHSFIHSFVRSFVHSLTHSSIHPSIHPSVHPSVPPCVCVRSFLRRFVDSPIFLFSFFLSLFFFSYSLSVCLFFSFTSFLPFFSLLFLFYFLKKKS